MDEYIYTPGDGVVVKGDPEPGKVYKEGDFNRIITIPAREERRVQYWMDRFNPNEKTIVFCATQVHAGMVRDFINQYAVKKVGPPIPAIVYESPPTTVQQAKVI